MTAFLERFFERYVSYDFTAELEEELDDVSGGRAEWQKVLEAFWRDFKPKTGEVMEQKPSEITAALDEFLAPYLFPPRDDGSDPRLCPKCGNGRLALRGGKFGAFVACSNYPDCKYTQKFGQGGEQAQSDAARPETRRRASCSRPAASAPISSWRGKEQARLDPQGRAARGCDLGSRASGCCRCRARSARIPETRQADHRLDRPLRPLSRA